MNGPGRLVVRCFDLVDLFCMSSTERQEFAELSQEAASYARFVGL